MLKNGNSESLILFGIAKIVIGPVGFGRHKTNLVYFSKLKALVDSEIGIFTSKHDPIYEKFRVIIFGHRAKTITQNLEST